MHQGTVIICIKQKCWNIGWLFDYIKNSVSTQCDIVMYDKDTIPLIDNGIAHFYPVEIVKGIGEVKSTLNKVEFTKALVKLARNKLLYQERKED